MKIVNYAFLLIFLCFAALQYNDPDAFLWIAIYMAMVIFCFLASRNKYFFKFTVFLAAVYIGYAAILSPAFIEWLGSADRNLLFDDLAKMQFPYIEETREFLGLIICLIVIALNHFIAARRLTAD